jgi:hypothetical protein
MKSSLPLHSSRESSPCSFVEWVEKRHCSQRFVQIKETGNAHLKSGLSHNLSLCTLAKTAQQTTRPSNPAGFCGDKRRTQQRIDPGYQRGNRWPIWPVCTCGPLNGPAALYHRPMFEHPSFQAATTFFSRRKRVLLILLITQPTQYIREQPIRRRTGNLRTPHGTVCSKFRQLSKLLQDHFSPYLLSNDKQLYSGKKRQAIPCP